MRFVYVSSGVLWWDLLLQGLGAVAMYKNPDPYALITLKIHEFLLKDFLPNMLSTKKIKGLKKLVVAANAVSLR